MLLGVTQSCVKIGHILLEVFQVAASLGGYKTVKIQVHSIDQIVLRKKVDVMSRGGMRVSGGLNGLTRSSWYNAAH